MHEHVSMSLLKVDFSTNSTFCVFISLIAMAQSQEAGVPTPKFGLAKTAAEAKKIAEDIAGNDLVHA